MPDISQNLKPSEKVLLVGAGKMGAALLQGWLEAGLMGDQLIVLEPHPSEPLLSLAKDYGFSVASSVDAVLPVQPRIIVLAVKPQVASDVLPNIEPLISQHDASAEAGSCCVLSLMAGARP